MFLLKHVPPEEAEGAVAEAYGVIPKNVPVPEPLQLFSVSPELARVHGNLIRYFGTLELDFGFFALLRLVVADLYGYDYCVGLNSVILEKAGGLSREELRDIRENPENVPLEEPQKSLFLFALRVVKDPESITEADVDALRELGFSDSIIFDVCYHASMLLGPSVLYKAFRR